jgi:glucose/arabinose dehydrogenase
VAKGWPEGARPIAAPSLAVAALATGLDHPRWVYVPPNGDVLAAEGNAPPKTGDGKGIKGADDIGNVIWRVTNAAGGAQPASAKPLPTQRRARYPKDAT